MRRAESVCADPFVAISEALPQKNTFVHFEDDDLPNLHLHRSVTCPASQETIVQQVSVCRSPKKQLDVSDDFENQISSSQTFPVEQECAPPESDKLPLKKRWADLSEDEKTPANLTAQEQKGQKRWADLSEDEQTPANLKAQKQKVQKRLVDLSEDEETPANLKAQVPANWLELAEDEQPGIDDGTQLSDHASDISKDRSDSEDCEETKSSLSSSVERVPKPSRSQFAKPTREARTREFQAKLDELFNLSFDEVDSSQRDGLIHQILVGLKSLAEMVTFWQADGTEVSEEGFKLLGLEETDMYALGRIIRKAEKFLEERRFREAYVKLSKARRWFDPATLLEDRAKANSRADKKAQKEKGEKEDWKAVCDSDKDDEDDEWTQVKKKKDKKKTRDEAPKSRAPACDRVSDDTVRTRLPDPEALKKEQPRSKNSDQISNAKQQLSNVNHQTSDLRPQTFTLKGQVGQGRKEQQKRLCRYNVGIEQDRAFNVVRKLLGDRGSHMKIIAANTGAKLRIRGRGSGFCEGPDQKEASDEPLMLCISAPTHAGFDSAVEDIESLLEYVHDQYRTFCKDRKLPVPRLSIVQDEQPVHH